MTNVYKSVNVHHVALMIGSNNCLLGLIGNYRQHKKSFNLLMMLLSVVTLEDVCVERKGLPRSHSFQK